MFIEFFYTLRERGIPVSPTSFLRLQKALKLGMVRSVEDFYTAARAILVKSERYFDTYDQVFAHFFKGVTLSEPDEIELTEMARAGRRAGVLIVVQMGRARYFTPNRETQPAFADALLDANLIPTGHDSAGDLRAVELLDHPFFVATLFQPERAALKGITPPLAIALLKACQEVSV